MQSNSRDSRLKSGGVQVRVGCYAAYAKRLRMESCALAHCVLP